MIVRVDCCSWDCVDGAIEVVLMVHGNRGKGARSVSLSSLLFEYE